jgi:hypothetical protein
MISATRQCNDTSIPACSLPLGISVEGRKHRLSAAIYLYEIAFISAHLHRYRLRYLTLPLSVGSIEDMCDVTHYGHHIVRCSIEHYQ